MRRIIGRAGGLAAAGSRVAGILAVALAALVSLGAPLARAEVSEIRISKGFGILYLPLIVMKERGLLEEQARKAGLGEVRTTWLLFDGGNVINDAMLAGALDVAGTGAPGFITLWSKARGTRVEVTGVSALSATSLWLMSNRPGMTSLADVAATDRIALPGIKTSLSAVVLQMTVAKAFGAEAFARLDPMTVGLSHPDAVAALKGGRTEITAHFTSPPFSYIERDDPKIHRVMSSVDVLGNITLDVVFATKRFVDQNPKLMAAFLAAQEEANAFIAADRRGAAEIFVKASPVKVSVDEVVRMLDDPDTRFSSAPQGIMDFVTFMARAGSIKASPAAWTDLFMPALAVGRQGS